jgi:hypothetical protein
MAGMIGHHVPKSYPVYTSCWAGNTACPIYASVKF